MVVQGWIAQEYRLKPKVYPRSGRAAVEGGAERERAQRRGAAEMKSAKDVFQNNPLVVRPVIIIFGLWRVGRRDTGFWRMERRRPRRNAQSPVLQGSRGVCRFE